MKGPLVCLFVLPKVLVLVLWIWIDGARFPDLPLEKPRMSIKRLGANETLISLQRNSKDEGGCRAGV